MSGKNPNMNLQNSLRSRSVAIMHPEVSSILITRVLSINVLLILGLVLIITNAALNA